VAFVPPPRTKPERVVSEDKLAELVRRAFGVELSLSAMPGGASTRQYFRVDVGHGRSAVAMFVPEGGKAEEVHKAPLVEGPARWPFLEIRDLLAERGIDVPEVLAEDTLHGWLVIEDLGDDTLANWLVKNPNEREPLYRRVVSDLARAQNELAELPEGCVIAARTFDSEVLRWEIEHFREWALDGRGKSLAAGDIVRWNALADRLASRVGSLPSGFVHRDYQSRNIMVVPGAVPERPRLVWIDFQDALLGPRVYDLVALFNDSFQEFDRAFVEARLADYASAAALEEDETDGASPLHASLLDEFDLVTIQRKMKDAGRFVFIDRRKDNPAFVRFVTPTIKKIGGALTRLAPRDQEMAELHRILARALGDELSTV
jgi:aminoglycoside/choline kinase family phosphotransferase